MFNSEVYVNRRKKLKESMGNGIILLPGNNDIAFNYAANPYHFRQDSNFLYFFGLDYQGLFGIIDLDEDKEIVFGNDVTMDDIIWMGPQPSLKENALKAGINTTDKYNAVFDYVAKAKQQNRKIHFLPPYHGETKILLESLIGIPTKELQNNVSEELIKAIVALRNIKEDIELKEIEKAADIGYKMHVTAMKMAKPGIVEQEIAGTIEGIAIAHGGMVSFPVILSQNGQTLHNHDHSGILEKGRMMLTDAGAETPLHYASDFTRTVPVGGVFTPRQKDIYNIVLNANNTVTANTKPGVLYKEMHWKAAEVIFEGLKELGIFKGNTQEAVNMGVHAVVFPHGLGHMMGMDVHDMEGLGENFVGYDDKTPRSTELNAAPLRLGREMKPGYVFTNEPGIYFIPELIEKWKADNMFKDFINYDKLESYIGFGGIRLEDDLVVTETGCKLIGKRVPITVEEIEETMK